VKSQESNLRQLNGNIDWHRASRASSIHVTKRLYCLAARSGIWREYRADVSSQVERGSMRECALLFFVSCERIFRRGDPPSISSGVVSRGLVASTTFVCPFSTRHTPKPNLFLSAFRFEHFTHSAARNSFAFHGIASEDDFGA